MISRRGMQMLLEDPEPGSLIDARQEGSRAYLRQSAQGTT